MEFLGTITDRPKMRKRGHFKWEYINLMYESDSLYNEASGKIVKILNSDGKALIKDTDGKNILDQEVSSLPPPKYANLAEAESQFPFEYLLKEYKTKEVIVSYDRLSHVSGILQKLGAISRFFEINPQYWKNKKVVFIQIIFGINLTHLSSCFSGPNLPFCDIS